MTAALPPKSPTGQEAGSSRLAHILPRTRQALEDLAGLAAQAAAAPWARIVLDGEGGEGGETPVYGSPDASPWPADARFVESLHIPDAAGRHLGTLQVGDREDRDFPADARRMLEGLARQAAALLALDPRAEARERVNDPSLIAPHFKTFLDHLPTTAFIKGADHRYVFANKAFWKLYNGTGEEGDPLEVDEARRLAPDSLARIREADRSVLETGQPLEKIEKLRYDGGEHTWWVCKFPITDSRGRRQVGGITLDISELDKARSDSRLFDHVFKNIEVGVLVWRLEDERDLGSFRLLALNAAACRMMSLEAGGLLGRPMRESFPAVIALGIAAVYKRVMDTGRAEDLGEVVYGDENIAPSHFTAKVFPLPERTVGVAFENITEQKRVQEQLRRSVERFELIARASHDGLWEADVRANEAWWSDRMHEILGYEPGAIVPSQRAWEERIHPEDRDKAIAALGRSLQDGAGHWTREYRIVRPDGSERHIYARGLVSRDAEGHPLKIIGSVTDITEVKAAEAALRENEERYRKLVELLPDVVAISIDDRLEFINPAGVRYRGAADASEMLGRTTLDFVHPDDWPGVMARRKRLAEGSPVPPVPFRFLRANGTAFEAESRAIPFPYRGRPANLIVIRDVTERKRAEEALRRSEEHYRLLFHGSPQPMYLADLETLRFLDVNHAAELQYGWTREEFLEMTLRDIRPPEDIPFLEQKVRSLRAHRGNMGVWRHRRKDGTAFQAEIIAHPMETYDRPDACLTIAHDVTGKLQALEKLRHSEERYRTLARVSPVGLFRTDRMGLCNYVNEHCILITGLSSEELEGRGWQSGIHPDDRHRVAAEWERTLALDIPFHAEYRFVRPDGKYAWVLGRALADRGPDGALIGYVGTLTDITERKQAETLLAVQKRTLAMVASGWALADVLAGLLQYVEKESTGLQAGILLCDGDSRRLAWASAPALPEELRNALDQAPVAAESGPPGRAAADRRLAACADIAAAEGWTRSRAEAEAAGYRSCTAVPIKGSHGSLLGVIVSFSRAPGEASAFDLKLLETASDLAGIAVERWRQEETGRLNQELSEENRRILEANRMKSEFMASMSHELRTPLNAIIGFSQLLIDRKVGAINGKQAEYLGDILDGGMHLLRLINDVLDLAKIESGKMQLFPEPVSVPRAIREVCDILTPMALPKGIVFRIEADLAPETARLDSQKFKQVLYNLISNAIKFSGQGAQVRISATRGEVGELRLRVTDQGIGIRKEDIGKLFQEFQQLDSGAARHFPGTGLGLVITKKLVELHRGTVGVESEAGKGSTFSAVFPEMPEGGE